jgi:hypothetical protein
VSCEFRDIDTDEEGFYIFSRLILFFFVKVNKRLGGDISEDPRYPKVQFPPTDLCSGCMDDGKGTWDEEKVFSFLTKYYGSENIVNSNKKLTSVIVVSFFLEEKSSIIDIMIGLKSYPVFLFFSVKLGGK